MNGGFGNDWRHLREGLRQRRIEMLIGDVAVPAPRRTDQVRIGRACPFEWIGLEWHVVVVKGGREGEAREYLELAGTPVFLMEERIALRQRRGPARDGDRGMIDRPLWPGYLFVASAGISLIVQAMDCDGRADLVPLFGGILGGEDGALWRVPGAAMQALFIAHEQRWHAPRSRREALRKRFAIGQRKTILDGPFAAFGGIINRFVNGQSAEILAEIFGRQTPVIVPLDKLG